MIKAKRKCGIILKIDCKTTIVIVICVNYKLVLIMGTYHLPQQELNHMLLQLLIFNTLWKEFRVESRSRHFVFGTKTGRTSLQVVGYFLELILWASFLYLLISRKALTFFTVITVSCDQQKLQKNSNIYIYIYVCVCVCVCVLEYIYSPFTKIIYILTFTPFFFGTVSQSYLRCHLPGCSPHLSPNKT